MKISQKLFDLIPEVTINNPERLRLLNRAGDIMGRPMPNRLILGATAIIAQPLIDGHNKRVDKQTARASRNRTIGKIIAGTTVGCIVRSTVYNLITKFTKEDLSTDKLNNILTPRNIKHVPKELIKNKMRNYRTAISTIVAMFVMLGTNILFDVPLTTYIANKLNKRDYKKELENINTHKNATSTSNNIYDVRKKMKESFNISKGGNTWKYLLR